MSDVGQEQEGPSAAGDFNQKVMAEFRQKGGVVGGPFEGALLLLLTTTGAKSGRPHTNPVVCTREEAGRERGSEGAAGRRSQAGSFLVYASNAGGPVHPQWYRNLLADPRAVVEIGEGRDGAGSRAGDTHGGTVVFAATAEIVTGAERDRLYAEQCARDAGFAAYEQATDRVIPVVRLRRVTFTDPERNRALGAFLLRVHAELRAELAALTAEVEGYATEDRAADRAVDRAADRAVDRAADPRATAGPGEAVALSSQVAALSGEVSTAEGAAAGAEGQSSATRLRKNFASHCFTFCGSLHQHHLSEDGAFGGIEETFPELGPVISRLRAEHRALAESLDSVERSLEGRREGAPDIDAQYLAAELGRLSESLEEHFAYEEHHVVPALLGAGADIDADAATGGVAGS